MTSTDVIARCKASQAAMSDQTDEFDGRGRDERGGMLKSAWLRRRLGLGRRAAMPHCVARVRAEDRECPLSTAMSYVGEWWTTLILHDCFDGYTRFDLAPGSYGD